MRHLVVLVALIAACCVTFVALSPDAGASTPPHDGQGTIVCSITGTVRFSKGLAEPGVASIPKVTMTAKLSSCSASVEPNVVGARMRATGTLPSTSCADFAAAGLPALNLRVIWKTEAGTPRLTPTVRTLTRSAPIIEPVEGDIMLVASGPAGGTGSFATDSAGFSTLDTPPAPGYWTNCASPHGQRLFSFYSDFSVIEFAP
jgi:hypothetical protein